jgi:hypothetical protein
VEVDRGTERGTGGGDRWAAKLSAYGSLLPDREAMAEAFGETKARLVVFVPDAARAAWVLRRAADTAAARFLWVGVWPEIAGRDVYAPAWRRPVGEVSAFVPRRG